MCLVGTDVGCVVGFKVVGSLVDGIAVGGDVEGGVGQTILVLISPSALAVSSGFKP